MRSQALEWLMQQAEIYCCPDIGRRQWQITREVNSKGVMVWYIAPKPYKYGFGTALDEKATLQQFEQSSTSVPDFVKGLVWC